MSRRAAELLSGSGHVKVLSSMLRYVRAFTDNNLVVICMQPLQRGGRFRVDAETHSLTKCRRGHDGNDVCGLGLGDGAVYHCGVKL